MKEPIYAINNTETVEGLKEWCLIDVTGGAVPLKKQLQSAARIYGKKRAYAAGVMREVARSLS